MDDFLLRVGIDSTNIKNPLDTQIEFGMAIRQAVDVLDASQVALYI